MRRWLKRAALGLAALLGLVLVAALAGGLWLRAELRASLPLLDGELRLPGLDRPVVVERDALGVPTVRGSDRVDLARATGFLHGQERFFQMDLLRRGSAGELAALVGPALLAQDRATRLHRLRDVAVRNFRRAGDEARTILVAYAEGVNAGLGALGARPPEYLALRSEPAPWRPEDTSLVVLAMYIELQDETGRRESSLGVMHDLLPRELVEFLAPRGSQWDAPLVGEPYATPPVPTPEIFDLRSAVPRAASVASDRVFPREPLAAGSNNWAVAGRLTADGGALLANDMHLGLSMPNIWYRISLAWPDAGDPGTEHRITGVTLPGAPPVIVGSNGHVAWGFTNSYGDFSDLILLEPDPDDDEAYLTPDGPRRLEKFEERIEVKGAADETLEVLWTVWGPVFDRDHSGRRRAMRWVAHDVESVNLDLMGMEHARDLDQAVGVAHRAGIPTQNCVIADRHGRVGWTPIGPLPRRTESDGQRPVSWTASGRGWDGYLPSAEYPRILDPADGRLWTANNRVGDLRVSRAIGDGGFVTGARARQIRDGLREIERADVAGMLDVQLDDRALFLERWRDLLLLTLDDAALRADPRRGELREAVENTWTGRASVDSVGFRMVRAFRLFLAESVFGAITASCEEADERFDFFAIGRFEGPLWRLVSERPLHLLDPAHASWDDQLLAGVDRVLDRFGGEPSGRLARHDWGSRNTVRMRHPLSLAVPQLSRWLDMPPERLPGDGYMPRVQGIGFGASQRMVVSPGREESGIFHMPGGQSGHPLSPYYRKGHEAWARGEASPFLPGPAIHRLKLVK